MDQVLFHSIWTVLLLVLFIAIWAWAWSKKRKHTFDAASRLPFADDELNETTRRGENNNG